MQTLSKPIKVCGDFLWGVSMIVMLVGTHIFLTVRQALVSMTETFWITVVVCTMTDLAVVAGIAENPESFGGKIIWKKLRRTIEAAQAENRRHICHVFGVI